MKYLYVLLFLYWWLPPVFAGEIKEVVADGIVKLSIGKPDRFTPYAFCPEKPRYEAIKSLPEGAVPFSLEEIRMTISSRGCQIRVPLQDGEQLYGFGLQIGSFQQRGLKKKPIVNDHPLNTLGYTHAPQTFYISTLGYGILINTSRYTTFYCGTHKKKDYQEINTVADGAVSTSTDELYKNERTGNNVYIDIPGAEGIEIYVISGRDMLSVVQRYNLFSGGGCLPPLWGLGFKYRTKTDFTQEGVLRTVDYFRKEQIPCDVIGLEPGWHTAAYSCSYVWNKERFPDHLSMLSALKEKNFKVNLWEHAYVHPSSPIYEPMQKYAGDYLVWKGLVPDFTLQEARDIYSGYHKKLMDEGIAGFKLDECDNSNISTGDANWGFPEMTIFPSGIDGEQMHQLFGALYLNTLNEMYKKENKRTYQDYRASGLFVSSIPATLYSDIYGHRDYVQMLCNSAFGGLLWSPEVRQSGSEYEFFHRLQTVLLSPQAVVNSWFLQNPPWLQYDKDKNNRNEFLADQEKMEDYTRQLINIRMQLIPYLYDAFSTYYEKGIPPFRPLVMDYPSDKKAQTISDQYMMGANLLVTPLFDNSDKRIVYLPEGNWYNYNTNKKYEGGREYEITVGFDEMPLFVKDGTILPLADPVQYITESTVFNIVCHVYGNTKKNVTLFEDDGVSYNYRKGEYNLLSLWIEKGKGRVKRSGNYKVKRYHIKDWVFIE